MLCFDLRTVRQFLSQMHQSAKYIIFWLAIELARNYRLINQSMLNFLLLRLLCTIIAFGMCLTFYVIHWYILRWTNATNAKWLSLMYPKGPVIVTQGALMMNHRTWSVKCVRNAFISVRQHAVSRFSKIIPS